MSEDNVFTLFLKAIFVIILIFLALALILPFISALWGGLFSSEIIDNVILLFTISGIILLILGMFLLQNRIIAYTGKK